MDMTKFFSEQSPPDTESDPLNLEKMCQAFNADPHTKRHYTNVVKIGEGGNGLVFQAMQKYDKKKHALKVMLNDDYGQREIEMLAAMKHQNIVQYITSWDVPLEEPDVVASDERGTCIKSVAKVDDFYLVMQTELCQPGESVEVLINHGQFIKMDILKKRNIVIDIICGVQYIHEQGIMHRDLKPANILIGMDGRAKIADFGFARKYLMSNVESKSAISKEKRVLYSSGLGTELYCAPEVMKSGDYDFKVDYYSLGIIIYEIYCNVKSVRDRQETIVEIRKMNYKDLDGILKDFTSISTVVKTLLNHDASLRKSLDWVMGRIPPLEDQVGAEEMKNVVLPLEDQAGAQDVESPTHDRIFADSEHTSSEEQEQILNHIKSTDNVIDYLT